MNYTKKLVKRLIDVDEAIDALGVEDEDIYCKSFLKECPIVDAVEVVHGRWKYYKKEGIAVCTECSFERKLDDDFGAAVSCPNCGAKMDGE